MQRGGTGLFLLALLAALLVGGLASTVAWRYEDRAAAEQQPPSALPVPPVARASVAPSASAAAGAPAAVIATAAANAATVAASPAPTGQATAPAAPSAAAGGPAGGNVENGRQVFAQNCNACHPNGDQGIGPAVHGAAFRGQFADNAKLSQVITNGRGGMPAFGGRLSPQQISDVIAYIRSLP